MIFYNGGNGHLLVGDFSAVPGQNPQVILRGDVAKPRWDGPPPQQKGSNWRDPEILDANKVTYRIHVCYISLHLVDFYRRCRSYGLDNSFVTKPNWKNGLTCFWFLFTQPNNPTRVFIFRNLHYFGRVHVWKRCQKTYLESFNIYDLLDEWVSNDVLLSGKTLAGIMFLAGLRDLFFTYC